MTDNGVKEMSQSTELNQVIPALNGISKKYQIEKWFYAPIEEQGQHRGFTILLLIIPIYERYLRYICNNYDGNFSKGSPTVNEIMGDFGVNEELAFQFWQIMRNGLLHRGTPKQAKGLRTYGVTNEGPPIKEANDGRLIINPYAIRPLLLNLFRDNPAFWVHSDYPVPDEVIISDTTQQPEAHYTQTRPHIS